MGNLPRYIDIVFCLIVFPVMVLIFPMERWFHNFQWYIATVVAWLYIIYFLNRSLAVPLLFGTRKKRWIGVLLILITFLISYQLFNVTLFIPKPSIYDEGLVRFFPHVLPYQQAEWSLFMIVEAFSFAISLLTQANLQRARRRAVEAERDKAEIALYRAQIKPHFMFNTLNSLYGLFLTHDEKALVSLEKFISMLRYIHTSAQNDFVPLAEEADHIREYVELQSLRLNEMTEVDLDVDIADAALRVPPMLLVTFVENCFKHGVSPVEKGRISIFLSEFGGRLILKTRNRIYPVRRASEHMGIGNCRKRLEMLYPAAHSLEIADDGNAYEVKLTIDLKK